MRRLADGSVTLGCDPEIFLTQNGKIVEGNFLGPLSRVAPDGVQVELHPDPAICRELLGVQIAAILTALKQRLKSNCLDLSFSVVVTIPQEDLSQMSTTARQLGCAPSKNAYNAQTTINNVPSDYNVRSAGGHIHLGSTWLQRNRKVAPIIAQVMDVVVGNTCVLLDRDPQAAERRTVYGQAGEYRTPAHGFEYRVLSNFWLRSYQLFHFVMGLARLGYAIARTPGAQKAILEAPLDQVQMAINTNNFELAEAIYKEYLRPVIIRYLPNTPISHEYGLDAGSVSIFDWFYRTIPERGLTYWFPDPPLEHWPNYQYSVSGLGWEGFLYRTVAEAMASDKIERLVKKYTESKER